jgi:hypothetical protein
VRRSLQVAVCVNGFIFDTVRVATPELFGPEESWIARRRWLKDIQALAGVEDTAGLAEAERGIHRQAHISFLRTLCGDLIHSLDSVSLRPLGQSEEDIDPLEKWWDPNKLGETRFSGETAGTDRSVMDMSQGRSFVVTDREYLGYKERQCRWGDLVAILEGVPVPFVLCLVPEAGPSGVVNSDTQQRYRVIGDAYICGIMKGEAFELHGRGMG